MNLRYVPDEVNPHSEYLVVGEAPGENEEREGRPFIGKSGQMAFDIFLSKAGIQRQECDITNTMPIKPPGGKFYRLKEIGLTKEQFEDKLRKKVTSRPWKMVIAIGDEALQSLTGKKGILNNRGSLLRDKWSDNRVFTMIHPAAMMRGDNRKTKEEEKRTESMAAWTMMDMGKLRRILIDDIQGPPKRDIMHWGNTKNVYTFLGEIKRLCSSPVVSFDIETFRGTITCMGLSDHPTRAVSVPFTGQFDLDDQVKLLDGIAQLMECPSWKVAQNASYDLTYLATAWRMKVRNFWLDTMVMHHLLHMELPHSLAFMTSQYTMEPFYKDMKKEVKVAEYGDIGWIYNGMDASVTMEVARELIKEALHREVYHLYEKKIRPLLGAICRVQMNGIKVDLDVRARLAKDLDEKIEEKGRQLQILIGEEVNVKSTKQMQSLLYNKWRLKRQYKKTGEVTTDADALRKLSSGNPSLSERLDLMISIREDRTMRSFYESSLEDDGRMRCFYNIAGTVTGRLSSSENIWGRGRNLQNIPDEAREMFIPSEEGWCMWGCDLAQAEDRFVAWDSGDKTLMDLYLDGKDAHRWTASILLGKEYDEVTKEERNDAKPKRHGWNYGLKENRLIEEMRKSGIKITLKEAMEIDQKLQTNLPGVVQWWGRTEDQLRSTRVLSGVHGRQRIFIGRMGRELYKKGYAFRPQNAIADQINFAIWPIERELKERKLRSRILLQVHDNLTGECHPDDKDATREVVIKWLTIPMPLWTRGVQLQVPGEWKVGKNWKEVS